MSAPTYEPENGLTELRHRESTTTDDDDEKHLGKNEKHVKVSHEEYEPDTHDM